LKFKNRKAYDGATLNKEDSLLDFSQVGEMVTHPPEDFISHEEDIDDEMDRLIKEVRAAEQNDRENYIKSGAEQLKSHRVS
jgi:hypothetical protein